MSKLTKLLNNPKLFALDFAKKRIDLFDVKEVPKIKVKVASTTKSPNKVKSSPVMDIISRSVKNTKESPIIFHCGEEIAAGWPMCETWLQLTKEFNKQAIFLIRSLSLYKKILEYFPNRNIAYAKTPIEIESFINDYNVHTVCYLSNTANNIHLIRFNHLKHIFVGGFDEERQPNSHKYFRAYDECWVYSQERNEDFERFVDLRHLNVIQLNNPKKYLFEHNPLNITYFASTNGVESNSYHLIDDIYKNPLLLGRKFSVFFNDKIPGIEKYLNSLGVFYSSDQIILDFTGIGITDFSENNILKLLKNNIPTIVYIPENTDIFNFSKNNTILDFCYTYKNLSELNSHLDNLLNGNDLLMSKREDFIKFKFGIDYLVNDKFESKINDLFKGLV